MWAGIIRAQYARADLASPRDLTHAEWAGAMPSAAVTGGTSVQMVAAADYRDDPVSAARRAALAYAAAMLFSGLDRETLGLPVVRQWSVALAQIHRAADRPGSCGTRGLSQRWGYR